jgi:integrase
MQNGVQVRRSLGVTDLHVAERMKAEIEQNMDRGKAGLPQSHVDAYELFEEFKSSVIHKKSPIYAKRLFQQLRPFLLFLQKNGTMNLAKVTVTDIEQHLDARIKVLCAKSWNDELRVIERFFRFAVERDYIAHNPAEKIQKHRVVKHSVEIFTPEELGLIFKYAHRNSVAFYKMLLFTGMRDGEARHLQWQDVILAPGSEHIKIRSPKIHLTKNQRDRVVPLCAEAIEVFKELFEKRDKNNPFVFTGRNGGHRGHNRNTWVACLKRIEKETGLKIEKGHHLTGLHMFRHTFATNALASGVDMRTVQDWLGHSSITQTQRYTNLLPSQKQEQIQKLVIKIEKPRDAPPEGEQ